MGKTKVIIRGKAEMVQKAIMQLDARLAQECKKQIMSVSSRTRITEPILALCPVSLHRNSEEPLGQRGARLAPRTGPLRRSRMSARSSRLLFITQLDRVLRRATMRVRSSKSRPVVSPRRPATVLQTTARFRCALFFVTPVVRTTLCGQGQGRISLRHCRSTCALRMCSSLQCIRTSLLNHSG